MSEDRPGLKLALIQFTPAFGKKRENLARIETLTKDLVADILVLPELCTTGYFFLSREEVARVAEPASGPTGAFFQELARRKNAVVVAGFAESAGGHFYNAGLIVVPESSRPWVYRKTHLFYREPNCFDPGDTGFFVVDDQTRDIHIGLMICYDWRFPEAARVLTLLGADLIVCPSNLVTDLWRTVMPARAIENKVYVAVANRAGREQRGEETLLFTGHSAIYGYDGEELQKAGSSADAIVMAQIFPRKTRDKSFNASNDLLRDRRPEYYQPLARKV